MAPTEVTTDHLPAPPDDDELYWSFGPQGRWVLLCSSLSFVFTAVTLFFFSLRNPALWVFLAVLVLVLNLVGLFPILDIAIGGSFPTSLGGTPAPPRFPDARW